MSCAIGILALVLLLIMPFRGEAESSPRPEASTEQLLKSQEIDALVAPIALYPDTLLAQVLMASTYPLEVVQAERWATEHKSLDGDRLRRKSRSRVGTTA